MLRRLATATALVSLLLAAGPGQALAEGVNERFGKAQRLYTQGKLKPAYKQLVALVRKYPEHQPSRLLLGRVLFRSGQVARAASQFKRVSPDMLSGDVAYEYGIAFYQMKDYRRAKLGLARVPSTSKFFDLACFYRGLAHFQTREYQKAQLYLSRAKRLPQNLVRTRRDALTQARRLARSESRGVTRPSAAPPLMLPPPIYAYPTYETNVAPSEGAPAEGAPPAKKTPPPPPQVGFSYTLTPSLTLTQTAVSMDYFGSANEQSESFSSLMGVAIASRYDAQPNGAGQAYVSVGANLSEDSSSSRGSKVSYKAFTGQPNEIIEVEDETAPSSSKTGMLKFSPEAGYPASSTIDLKVGYSYEDSLPDFKSKDKTNTSGPYGSGEWSGESLTIKLSGSQSAIDSTSSQVISTTTTFGGEAIKTFESSTVTLGASQSELTTQRATPLTPGAYTGIDSTTLSFNLDLKKDWTDFTLTAGADMVSVENPNAASGIILSGAASSMTLSLIGEWTFEFGGSINLSLESAQLSDYQEIVDNLVDEPQIPEGGTTAVPPKILAKGNGTRNTASGTFKLSPVDWIFGSATLSYTTLAIGITDPKAEAGFQKVTPEVIQTLTLQAGLTKTF